MNRNQLRRGAITKDDRSAGVPGFVRIRDMELRLAPDKPSYVFLEPPHLEYWSVASDSDSIRASIAVYPGRGAILLIVGNPGSGNWHDVRLTGAGGEQLRLRVTAS